MSSTLKDNIKETYGRAAREAATGAASCCGTPSRRGTTSSDYASSVGPELYTIDETSKLPAAALLASMGCGNPTALADLRTGETVLDLGAGGGIDVLLSARRVGPTGKVYGLDMTDEMLELARENQLEAGIHNVRFLKGDIEDIPLPDASVDVIISNCVINLSADKNRVFAEAFRVLRPGGRFAVSDILVRGSVSDDLRADMNLWVGCVAGALEEIEYKACLESSGFTYVAVEPTRIFGVEDARNLAGSGSPCGMEVEEVGGKFMSAFIRAVKP